MRRLLFEVVLITVTAVAGYFVGYEHHGVVIDKLITEADAAEATSYAASTTPL